MALATEKLSNEPEPGKSGGMTPIYLAIGLAIGGIGVFAGVFAWFFSGASVDFDRELTVGLQKLKREVSADIRRLVLSMTAEDLATPPLKAKWELIVGAVALEDSEKSAVRERAITLAEEAFQHLKESQSLGFPRGYDGLGNFLLGKVLYQLFRWEEAVEPLEIAATEWPAGRTDALSLLNDIDIATEGISEEDVNARLDFWNGLVGLTSEDRNREKLKRIATMTAFQEYDGAMELAKSFPTDSIYFTQAQHQYSIAKFQSLTNFGEASEESTQQLQLAELYQQMRSVAKGPNLDPVSQRQNQYYSGIVLQRLNRWEESIGGLNVLRQSSPHTIEGLSGAVAEMKGLVKLQRFDEVVVTIRQVTEQFGKEQWYNNSWQPIPLLRSQIKEVGQELLVNRAYPQVVEYANKMPPLCDRQDRLRLLSVGYGRWATSLRVKPLAVDSGDEAIDLRTIARDLAGSRSISGEDLDTQENRKRVWQKLFNESAKSYEELAMIQMRSPEYFDLIWEAITNYQSAGDLTKCNSVIETTLPFEPVSLRPKAYLMMAENYFALNMPEKSLFQLQRCIIEHGTHPLSFRSRLNAARILAEQSKFLEAQGYLEQNLYDSSLSPDSSIWKESLFELGRNYYSQGEIEFSDAELLKQSADADSIDTRRQTLENANALFTKSIHRLGEWLKRYPDDPRRFDTLYSIGKAYQMAANYPEFLLADGLPTSTEIQKKRLQEYRELVQNARATFEQIRIGMNEREIGAIRSQTFRSLLRNSYFAEADLTYQLNDYEGALTLYRSVANRFIAEPEALEALTQAAECLKKLGRTAEGLRVISQAREVLDQIPPDQDAKFTSVTRFSRQQWDDLLSRMQNTIY